MKFLLFFCKKPRLTARLAFRIAALSFAVCTAALFVLYFAFTTPLQSTAAKQRKLPIYSVARQEKQIAISFDCAWGVDYTDKILDELDRHDIKCTWFAVEFWVEKYPEYAQKIVERGHELGTHSKTHPYMSKLSKTEMLEELKSSCSVIQKTTGIAPTLFRPPYGDYNDLLIETCAELNLYPIQWDVDSLDWKNLSATEISLRVINGAKAGSIIL